MDKPSLIFAARRTNEKAGERRSEREIEECGVCVCVCVCVCVDNLWLFAKCRP